MSSTSGCESELTSKQAILGEGQSCVAMAEHQTFAELLNDYLTKKRHSARSLALEIGVHPSTAARWANGETVPEDPEIVRRIAAAFELSDPAKIEALMRSAGYCFIVQASEDQLEAEGTDSELPKANAGHLLETFNTTLLRLVNAAPPALAAALIEKFHLYDLQVTMPSPPIHTSSSEGKGIDLAHRRLYISNEFGSYFAGLLERDNIHVEIDGQVDSPVLFGRADLPPLSRIMLALQHPEGPHMVVVAAEGGMGKSTLAAKIIRSLFEGNSVDRILGDSAKKGRVDAVTGEIVSLEPGYYDWQSCSARLYNQLGIPAEHEPLSKERAIRILRNRLLTYRAVIVIDNLESIAKGSHLLDFLRRLTSQHVRIVVTTRTVQAINSFAFRTMVVNLRPIRTIEQCRTFLGWHIGHFQQEYAALRTLEIEAVGEGRLQDLIKRTGGIPLLLQLIISTVARISWAYLDEMPNLFGKELLDFLYLERWHELGQAGHAGLLAQKLLWLVSQSQSEGKIVTLQMLATWAAEEQGTGNLQTALVLLTERFLIVNHDLEHGNFTVFPSLTDFLDSLESVQP